MRVLAFDPASQHGRRIREARFRERSTLPIAAACLVASGVREALAAILTAPVAVRLLEPVIPSPQAWPAIARGAALYRIGGSASDAVIVLRAADAAALAAAVFGERAGDASLQRPLSPIEGDVLDRTVASVVGAFAAVCGERESFERVQSVCGCVTYFEMLVEEAVEARIGVALSRDPAPERHGTLGVGDLGGLPFEPTVRIELAAASAADVARLTVGAVLPLAPSRGLSARLALGERTLARGTCGVRGGRYALAIESVA